MVLHRVNAARTSLRSVVSGPNNDLRWTAARTPKGLCAGGNDSNVALSLHFTPNGPQFAHLISCHRPEQHPPAVALSPRWVLFARRRLVEDL
jgi:hypothetical protein